MHGAVHWVRVESRTPVSVDRFTIATGRQIAIVRVFPLTALAEPQGRPDGFLHV